VITKPPGFSAAAAAAHGQ